MRLRKDAIGMNVRSSRVVDNLPQFQQPYRWEYEGRRCSSSRLQAEKIE